MSNLNGRLTRIEQAATAPSLRPEVHLGADGSIGLYRAGRLAVDLGATLAKIYGHELTTPAPETPGPVGPETLEQMIARIWNDES